MIYRDYLIVGAGLAGARACEGIREFDKKGSVTLIGCETFLPYARPPLSKSFLTNGKTAEDLRILSPTWFQKNKIELRLDTTVVAFDITRRLAVLQNGQTIEFNKALIATGSRPRKPNVAGATLGNVFYLNSVRDGMAIKEVVALAKEIIIIGGGTIALETAAVFHAANVKVTLMNRNQQLWQKRLDPETSKWLTKFFENHGVRLMMLEDINGFEGKTVLRNIQTKSGNRFPANMALVAVGAEPNIELVANTSLSSPNGTPVNEYLETDEKGIFAAGDIALYPDKTFGGVRRGCHWDCANEQGRIAGANMTGKKRIRFDYVPFYSSALFDLHLDFVGDFTRPPGSCQIEGSYDRRKFILRYLNGNKLSGVILCNQDAAKLKAARQEVRQNQ
jgi:NADPH-dependent 2,4-dienoyl-CoA reductase/sulfur reductase-like enzyme